MFSHLHSNTVAVKIFDHVLGKFRDLETAGHLVQFISRCCKIQCRTGRDSYPIPWKQILRCSSFLVHRYFRSRYFYAIRLLQLAMRNHNLYYNRPWKRILTRYVLPFKILSHRVKLESVCNRRSFQKGTREYLIEFRNAVYVPSILSALCKPTFSFLQLKQWGWCTPGVRQGWSS